jgi:hypothetical protein
MSTERNGPFTAVRILHVMAGAPLADAVMADPVVHVRHDRVRPPMEIRGAFDVLAQSHTVYRRTSGWIVEALVMDGH